MPQMRRSHSITFRESANSQSIARCRSAATYVVIDSPRSRARELNLYVRESSALATVLHDHRAVFKNELGTITCAKAEIHVDPQVPPSFHRPRPVPFALKQKVEIELERLQREGIIHPRQFSQWAAPIVAVPKSDGSVRLCGDYKVSANKAIICDIHPISRSEDIFAAMSGGISFSKLDLSHAYLQLQLAD